MRSSISVQLSKKLFGIINKAGGGAPNERWAAEVEKISKIYKQGGTFIWLPRVNKAIISVKGLCFYRFVAKIISIVLIRWNITETYRMLSLTNQILEFCLSLKKQFEGLTF